MNTLCIIVLLKTDNYAYYTFCLNLPNRAFIAKTYSLLKSMYLIQTDSKPAKLICLSTCVSKYEM